MRYTGEQVHRFLVCAGVHSSVGINADIEVQQDAVSREEADVPLEGAKVVHVGCELVPIVVGANPRWCQSICQGRHQ